MNKQILIVEDDLDDREMLDETICSADSSLQLKFAENGAEALKYLYDLKDTKALLPKLIILDLNLPYIDGLQTYKRIKADPDLNRIPIAIFTSSQNPNDKELFEHNGIIFLNKPYHFSHMKEIVSRMLIHAENHSAR